MGYFSLSGCVFFFFLNGYCVYIYIYVCDNICDIYIYVFWLSWKYLELLWYSMIIWEYLLLKMSKNRLGEYFIWRYHWPWVDEHKIVHRTKNDRTQVVFHEGKSSTGSNLWILSKFSSCTWNPNYLDLGVGRCDSHIGRVCVRNRCHANASFLYSRTFHITDGVEHETGPDPVGNIGHCMNIEIEEYWNKSVASRWVWLQCLYQSYAVEISRMSRESAFAHLWWSTLNTVVCFASLNSTCVMCFDHCRRFWQSLLFFFLEVPCHSLSPVSQSLDSSSSCSLLYWYSTSSRSYRLFFFQRCLHVIFHKQYWEPDWGPRRPSHISPSLQSRSTVSGM